MSFQLLKFPAIVRTGRGRDLQLPQLPPHPALHQLHHHLLRVHPGAGGLCLRGPGAKRQRSSAGEVRGFKIWITNPTTIPSWKYRNSHATSSDFSILSRNIAYNICLSTIIELKVLWLIIWLIVPCKFKNVMISLIKCFRHGKILTNNNLFTIQFYF